jgi:hypothetical protein
MGKYSAEAFAVLLNNDSTAVKNGLKQAGENALAWMRGQNRVALALPYGTRSETLTGPIAQVMKNLGLPVTQTVANLPAHALIPCLDAGSWSNWAVPGSITKEKKPSSVAVLYQSGYQRQSKDRPLLTLGLRPSIPGDLQYPEIWAGTAYWQPHRKSGIYPVVVGQSALAFSLGERKPVTEVTYMIQQDGNNSQLVYTPLLTAGVFAEGIMNWLNNQTKNSELLVQDHQVIDAIAALTGINPGLQVFWERLSARQELGAILAMHDPGGQAIAAALNCFLEAPSEKNKEIRDGAIATISQAVGNNEISNWLGLTRCIANAFNSRNIPLNLRIGSAPILQFLEQGAGLTLADNHPARKAVERVFTAGGKSYDLLLPGNMISLLMVDPRIINRMVSGILNRWVPEILGIVDAVIMGGEAALRAQRVTTQIRANAWLAAADAIAQAGNKTIDLARKAGQQVGQAVVGQIEADLNKIIQTAQQAPSQDGQAIIEVNQ